MRVLRPQIWLALSVCLCAPGVAVAAAPAVRAAAPAADASASGHSSARLHVAFVPDLAGSHTTIEMALNVLGSNGRPPPPLRSFALRLPAGMGIATTTLGEANCYPASLIAAGLSGCSANALLGYGSATVAVAVESHTVVEHALLHALMGPPRNNEVEVLFYAQAITPVFGQLVLPAVLAEDVAPYGERLQTYVPLVEVWPEGPDLALERISTTIGPLHITYHRRVGSRVVPFKPRGILIPSVCPRSGYPFAALLSFVDGTGAHASFHVPCGRN